MRHDNTIYKVNCYNFKYLGKLFTTIYVKLCSKQKPSGHWGVKQFKKKPKKQTTSRG